MVDALQRCHNPENAPFRDEVSFDRLPAVAGWRTVLAAPEEVEQVGLAQALAVVSPLHVSHQVEYVRVDRCHLFAFDPWHVAIVVKGGGQPTLSIKTSQTELFLSLAEQVRVDLGAAWAGRAAHGPLDVVVLDLEEGVQVHLCHEIEVWKRA